MTTKFRYTVEKFDHPSQGILYNVKEWACVDGKKLPLLWDGKYCKSEEEARKYIMDYKQYCIVHNSVFKHGIIRKNK